MKKGSQMSLKTHAVRVFWVLFRFVSTFNFQRVLGVCVPSKNLVITGSLCGGYQRSWLYHPRAVPQESWLLRDFMDKHKCVRMRVLTATSYIYFIYVRFVTNYMLSMFWYVSILFFMFVFVGATCKDLESRWCQNVKWMQGSFTSKGFMENFSEGIYTPRACYGWDPFFEGVPSLKLAVRTWK